MGRQTVFGRWNAEGAGQLVSSNVGRSDLGQGGVGQVIGDRAFHGVINGCVRGQHCVPSVFTVNLASGPSAGFLNRLSTRLWM